jgi:hypothetical protein
MLLSICIVFERTPPPEVVILDEEGISLICQHESLPVEWYKGDTEIDGDQQQESCDCSEVVVEGVTGTNLTFSNFTAGSVGEYSCRATFPNNTVVTCHFNVSIGISISIFCCLKNVIYHLQVMSWTTTSIFVQYINSIPQKEPCY